MPIVLLVQYPAVVFIFWGTVHEAKVFLLHWSSDLFACGRHVFLALNLPGELLIPTNKWLTTLVEHLRIGQRVVFVFFPRDWECWMLCYFLVFFLLVLGQLSTRLKSLENTRCLSLWFAH